MDMSEQSTYTQKYKIKGDWSVVTDKLVSVLCGCFFLGGGGGLCNKVS